MSARKGQVFIGFKCDSEFRDQLTAASGGALSQFVRDALIEKLQKMRIPVNRALAAAPSRLGKGGPRKIIRFQRQSQEQEQPACVAEDSPIYQPKPKTKSKRP